MHLEGCAQKINDNSGALTTRGFPRDSPHVVAAINITAEEEEEGFPGDSSHPMTKYCPIFNLKGFARDLLW